MIMAVASKVSEATKEKLLGPSLGIQTLRAIRFNDLLTSSKVILAFSLQTGECIGLLGVTLEDITFDSLRGTDPTARRIEDAPVAVVAAAEPLNGDA
jgi:hypothetical protein